MLAGLDLGFLAEKLARRGVAGEPARTEPHLAGAWAAYGASLRSGGHGEGAWCTFMRTLLADTTATDADVAFLFADQREANLWRAPVPGMIGVVQRVRARGVKVAIVSNSEGKLRELVDELGWSTVFPVIADSGALGLEKPGPGIFEWTAERLGVTASSLVHVGDSWNADVEGVLGVGGRAVWFPAVDDRAAGRADVASARRVEDVEAALALVIDGRPFAG